MLTELWLGLRYLTSGKKEKIISLTALISVIGIAIGVMVVIVVISVMSGFDKFLEDKMVGTNSHLIWEFYGGTAEPYALIEKLKTIPHIQAASPFIAGQAFLKLGQQVLSLDLRGIDPKLQPQISKIKEYTRRGTLDLNDNEAVLGEELALRLGINLGDKLSLISPVSLKAKDFVVKGIFNSGMYLYDSGLVMTNLKSAQDFFNTGNYVGGIAIRVDDIYRVEELKLKIYRNFAPQANYEVKTWVDANRNFLHALKLEKVVMFIVVTMTVVVAAFGIVSTLIMSVMSKIRDIGILRAVGAKAKSILVIFLFQGLSLGIIGILAGLMGGISLALSLNRIVDFISRIIGRSLIPKDIYYFDRIPTQINQPDIAIIVVSTLVISLLASFYPAYYAARINPCDALRHE